MISMVFGPSNPIIWVLGSLGWGLPKGSYAVPLSELIWPTSGDVGFMKGLDSIVTSYRNGASYDGGYGG